MRDQVADASTAGTHADNEGHKKGRWDDAIETVSLYGTMLAKQYPIPFELSPQGPPLTLAQPVQSGDGHAFVHLRATRFGVLCVY